MAARKKKGQIPEDAKLDEGGLFPYMRKAYRSYGKYVLEQRAVVDFRDGLKPVQRRILWATHELGLSGSRAVSKKSAKVVGDTMGKYHPHGDGAIYGALVTMTRSCNPPLVGVGNFGSQTDGPASMRYTECHLSRYSDLTFFDKRYLPVMDTVETYDGSEQEPLILPAVLPNLLLNGSYGLAVGATSSIPAFHTEGVIELTKRALQGEEITVGLCMDHLEPRSQEGGLAYLDDDDSKAELARFFETGKGSVYWYPDAELNTHDRSVLIKGFAPSFAKSLVRSNDQAEKRDSVSSIDNETKVSASGKSTDVAYRVTLKNNIEDVDIEDELYAVTKHFEVKQSLSFTITERKPPPEGSPDPDVRFSYTNMPEFFRTWAEWRTDLELRAIQHELDQVTARLHIVDGLKIAFRNMNEVIRIIRRSNEPKPILMEKFELSDKQAESILNMRLRQLAKLEKSKLDDEHKQLKRTEKRLLNSLDNPVPDILGMIDQIADKLDKVRPGS